MDNKIIKSRDIFASGIRIRFWNKLSRGKTKRKVWLFIRSIISVSFKKSDVQKKLQKTRQT